MGDKRGLEEGAWAWAGGGGLEVQAPPARHGPVTPFSFLRLQPLGSPRSEFPGSCKTKDGAKHPRWSLVCTCVCIPVGPGACPPLGHRSLAHGRPVVWCPLPRLPLGPGELLLLQTPPPPLQKLRPCRLSPHKTLPLPNPPRVASHQAGPVVLCPLHGVGPPDAPAQGVALL